MKGKTDLKNIKIPICKPMTTYNHLYKVGDLCILKSGSKISSSVNGLSFTTHNDFIIKIEKIDLCKGIYYVRPQRKSIIFHKDLPNVYSNNGDDEWGVNEDNLTKIQKDEL